MSLSVAVLEQLRADPTLKVNVGGAAPPYVVLYIDDGLRSRGRMVLQSRHAVVRFYTHSVGATDTASRTVAAKASRRLLDVVLAVPGWSCAPITQEASRPTARDESTGKSVFDTVAVWRLEADRTDEGEQP